MMLTDTGSLRIYNDTGWMTIERHADELTHADLSPDGTHVVATTGNGEILVWDLHAMTPLRARVPSEWNLSKMTSKSLWMMSPLDGVGRIDLQTGKLENVISLPGTLSMFVDDDDGGPPATRPTTSSRSSIASTSTASRSAAPWS